MKIIAYRPEKDLFWIGCTRDEAEKFFIPLISKEQEKDLPSFLSRIQEGYSDSYKKMVCEVMGIDEMSFIYFGVSRDLKFCYFSVPHHPFHQLWNGFSEFAKCDAVEIKDLSELKDVKPTYKGVPFDSLPENQIRWF